MTQDYFIDTDEPGDKINQLNGTAELSSGVKLH